MIGVIFGDIEGAADKRCERDQVLSRCLLRGGEEIPFKCEGVCEEGFCEGEGDDFFGCWVAEGAGVEVDLVCACSRPY